MLYCTHISLKCLADFFLHIQKSGQMDKVINSRFANHGLYLPIEMYGVQNQVHHIFLSFAHKGLLVRYIWHDF